MPSFTEWFPFNSSILATKTLCNTTGAAMQILGITIFATYSQA